MGMQLILLHSKREHNVESNINRQFLCRKLPWIQDKCIKHLSTKTKKHTLHYALLISVILHLPSH